MPTSVASRCHNCSAWINVVTWRATPVAATTPGRTRAASPRATARSACPRNGLSRTMRAAPPLWRSSSSRFSLMSTVIGVDSQMRHAFPNLWTTQLRPPDLAVDNSRPTLTPTTQDGTTGSCSPDRHSQAGGGEGHCGGREESDRGDTLPEPIRTGDVRKTSGSGTPPYGIRREARQRPGHTVSMGGGATTGTPGKPGSSSRSLSCSTSSGCSVSSPCSSCLPCA